MIQYFENSIIYSTDEQTQTGIPILITFNKTFKTLLQTLGEVSCRLNDTAIPQIPPDLDFLLYEVQCN